MTSDSIVNRYNHIYIMEWCFASNGHYTTAKKLPYWIHLTITKLGDSKYLTAHSRIHMNKCVRVGPEYSADFTDNQILKELSYDVSDKFL